MQTIEQRAIYVTILGNVGMALLGIGFALYTSSEAILLDAVFSGVNFIIALLSLRVAHLISQLDDERHPFGYSTYEPLLNLGKGTIVTAISLFASFSAIRALLSGGREIAAGPGVWYAAIAAAGCWVLAIVQRRLARRSKSPILELDAKNWFIDGVISGAVALAFVLVIAIERTPFAWFVPYADPSLVLLLVISTISIPLRIIRKNWRQIVLEADEPELQKQVKTVVEAKLSTIPYKRYHIRQGRIGRLVYVQIYIQLDKDTDFQLSQADRVRSQLYSGLQLSIPHLAMDAIFTTEPAWAQMYLSAHSPTDDIS